MKHLLTLLALMVSIFVNATTYYISPSGNDATGNGTQGNPWKTLSKASTVATAFGDIIQLTAGTFNETAQINIAPGVSLTGAGIDVTIVNSGKTGQWSLFLSLQSAQGTNGSQTIQGMTINGQYVSESNYKTWWGILVQGRSNVRITNIKMQGFYDRGIIFDGNDATDPTTNLGVYATGNKIDHCTLLNCARVATGGYCYGAGIINIGAQLGMEISDNTVIQNQRQNFKNGWPIKYWDNGWFKELKILRNTLTKAVYQGTYFNENCDWDFAIELFNIDGGVEVANNTIQGSIDINYVRKGSYTNSLWIHHNILDHPVNDHYESGIILEFAQESVLIENNTINNVSAGILFNARTPSENGGYPQSPAPTGGYSHLTNNIIRNNLITNVYQPSGCCGGVGIIIQIEGDKNDPYVRNLQIYNNTLVAKSTDAPWIGIDLTGMTSNNANVSGVYIKNNIVLNFQDSWLKGSNPTHMSNVEVTYNLAYGNGNGNLPSWPGGNPTNYTYNNHLTSNPLFVGGTDYSLQSTSPARNSGVDVGVAYQGSAPDRGYIEYSETGGGGGGTTNSLPIVNAGNDQNISLPTNSVTISGSGSDVDGQIVSRTWTKVAGPSTYNITNPGNYSTTVTSLVAGTYKFELSVVDDSGAVAKDTMQVIVNALGNIAPVANAGNDIIVLMPATVTNLSGSGSDADGTIVFHTWTKVGGPASYLIGCPDSYTPEIRKLVKGKYTFRLTVIDNNGITTTDDVIVTVKNP